MIEYRFIIPSAAVFTLYSYSKALEYPLEYPLRLVLVNSTLDMLSKQVEEEMNGVTSPIDPIIAPTNVTLPNELKKKEVETKTSKRKNLA
jgi:hypothetical protein